MICPASRTGLIVAHDIATMPRDCARCALTRRMVRLIPGEPTLIPASKVAKTTVTLRDMIARKDRRNV